jgi:hypothetical protein
MVSIDKKGEAFASPFLSINVEGSVFLPTGLHNAWQLSLVSSFTQLVTAKSKVAINTAGFACRPTTIPDPIWGAVAG